MTACDSSARAADLLGLIRTDPVWFCENLLGVRPWSRQCDVLRALATGKNVAVRSGHAVGKSFLAAACAMWKTFAYQPIYTLTTGASWQGVEKNIWGAIRRLHRNAPFRLSPEPPNNSDWMLGDQHGIFGLSTNTPENIAGFRSEYGAFVIVDEASDLTQEIFDAILGICSTEHSQVLLLGNPLRTDGPYHKIFQTTDPNWIKIHISSLESPNITKREPRVPGLADAKWVDAMRMKWTEGSVQWSARVEGNFPGGGADSLILLAWAQARTTDPNKLPKLDADTLRMGVDVARYGDDRTVLAVRDKHAVRHVEKFQREDTMQVVGHVLTLMRDMHVLPERIYIDDTGVGGGVVDRLIEQDYAVVPVVFGGAADEPEKYKNKRAEMYWRLRDRIKPAAEEPFLLPVQYADELANELSQTRFTAKSDGVIQLEEKTQIKKRLGASPDIADAVALTFAEPEDEGDGLWVM